MANKILVPILVVVGLLGLLTITGMLLIDKDEKVEYELEDDYKIDFKPRPETNIGKALNIPGLGGGKPIIIYTPGQNSIGNK